MKKLIASIALGLITLHAQAGTWEIPYDESVKVMPAEAFTRPAIHDRHVFTDQPCRLGLAIADSSNQKHMYTTKKDGRYWEGCWRWEDATHIVATYPRSPQLIHTVK